MPLTGICAWKEIGIGPEERIDRFFNLIDHAVENGVALNALYTRKHVKEFLLYTLHQRDSFCRTTTSTFSKDRPVFNLLLTSNFESSLVVGDPGQIVVTLPPKGSKTLKMNEVQLNHIKPQLEKLKTKGWLSYTITDHGDAVVPPPAVVAEVVASPTPVVVPPPAPVVVPPPAPVMTTGPAGPKDPPPSEEAEAEKPEDDEESKKE